MPTLCRAVRVGDSGWRRRVLVGAPAVRSMHGCDARVACGTRQRVARPERGYLSIRDMGVCDTHEAHSDAHGIIRGCVRCGPHHFPLAAPWRHRRLGAQQHRGARPARPPRPCQQRRRRVAVAGRPRPGSPGVASVGQQGAGSAPRSWPAHRARARTSGARDSIPIRGHDAPATCRVRRHVNWLEHVIFAGQVERHQHVVLHCRRVERVTFAALPHRGAPSRALPARSARLCVLGWIRESHRPSAGLPVDAPPARRLNRWSRWERGSLTAVTFRRAPGLAASRRRWLGMTSRSGAGCRRWLSVVDVKRACGASQSESSTRGASRDRSVG